MGVPGVGSGRATWEKTGPETSGRTAFRYPVRVLVAKRPEEAQEASKAQLGYPSSARTSARKPIYPSSATQAPNVGLESSTRLPKLGYPSFIFAQGQNLAPAPAVQAPKVENRL